MLAPPIDMNHYNTDMSIRHYFTDNSKIIIYINSKNRRTDETASNFNVIIPDGYEKLIVMKNLN